MINCLGSDNIAAIQKTIIPIPHVENTAVVTKARPLIKSRSRNEAELAMSWNRTETRYQSDLKAAISNNLCQTGICNLCTFEFRATSTAAILEGAETR